MFDITEALISCMQLTQIVRAHFEYLVKAGFTEEQALILTRDFQQSLLTSSSIDEDFD